MIREMRDRGMKITEIAKDLGMSRPTVRKYLKARRPPEYGKKRRVSKLEGFKPYIKERIDQYNLSAVRIMEEIKKKGYTGGYTILKDYCRTLRKDRAIKAVIRYKTKPGRQAQVDFDGVSKRCMHSLTYLGIQGTGMWNSQQT